MENLQIIAFTHRQMNLDQIGWLHVDEDIWKKRLLEIKSSIDFQEVTYLSTCNRVEFIFIKEAPIDHVFLNSFFKQFKPELDDKQLQHVVDHAELYQGLNAAEHLYRVASSIDSMVIGEREIITQVRKAFENSRSIGLANNYLNVLLKNTVENAKRVYTETQIATKPVSVVSLAYHRIKDLNIPLSARILIVGAGITNNNMAKFLYKHGFKNFTVFNRTLEKASALATKIGGSAKQLNELATYNKGFDLLITCTGAENDIITLPIFDNLCNGEQGKKVIIDLAVPNDTASGVVKQTNVKYINVERLKKVAENNLAERAKEISKVESIIYENLPALKKDFKQRSLEIAMRDVPVAIKDIKSRAINEVFAKELENMDDDSKETLEKIIAYMEKKYISLPMKMAKEILIEK